MPDQNRWDERYLRGEHTTQEPSPLLIKAIRDIQPGRALDIACGVGRHALYLAERGWQVTAVDSSRVGIEILRQRARSARIPACGARASCPRVSKLSIARPQSATRNPASGVAGVSWFSCSLRNLGGLCVSAVKIRSNTFTAE